MHPGGAFRTDHYPFCTKGVAAFSFDQDGNFLDLTRDEFRDFRKKMGEWYHEPNDEIYPFWRYEGIIQNLTTLYHIGRYYAKDGERPFLNADNPFNAPKRILELLYRDGNKLK